MRRLALATLPVLLLGGCDAYGGADYTGGDSEPGNFAIASRYPGPEMKSGVPVSIFVEVTFSTVIDTASVGPNAILLNGEAFGTVTVDGKKLRFTPATTLLSGTPYAITLDPDLAGANGHLLGPVDPWGFKTAGPPPPPDLTPPLGPRPR